MMGFGRDEAWEEDCERELTRQERHAIDVLEYDEGEWRDLPEGTRRQQMQIARLMRARGDTP